MWKGPTHSPLVSTLSSSLHDLGKELGPLGLSALLVVCLSTRQEDRCCPFAGNWGSERCCALLPVTQRISTRSGRSLPLSYSGPAVLGGTSGAGIRLWNLPWPHRTRAASVSRQARLRGSESLRSKAQLQTCASCHLGPDLSFSIRKMGVATPVIFKL